MSNAARVTRLSEERRSRSTRSLPLVEQHRSTRHGLAEKLGLDRIVIPADAGVGSAVGFLRAPAAYELVRSRFMRLDKFDAAAISALLTEMSTEAHALAGSAASGRQLHEKRVAYIGIRDKAMKSQSSCRIAR